MTEQEQVEEMRKTIKQGFQKADCRVPYTNEPYPYFDSQINYIAKSLYDAGYRKAPDGAVVLTPEERDEEVKETNKILSERDELKAENAELKSKIEELKLKCAALQMRNEVGQGISEATIYAKCIQKSGDCSWTEHDLQVGAYYKVEKIEMGQSYTSIYLEEFFRVYNSVYFEFYENGKEINIYEDKRFNPYIQDESF